MRLVRLIFLSLFIFGIILLTPKVAWAWTDCNDWICGAVYFKSGCSDYDSYLCDGQWGRYCECESCPCVGCPGWGCQCCPCNNPPCGGGGCFTGETEISVGQAGERAGEQEGETKEIKDLQPGDVVESFNPETGEVVEGTVEDVTKTTREGYYLLETESGEKVKVTGEHPFLAIKTTQQAISNRQQELIEKIENILSNTLTYKLITGLQAKVSEVLR